MQKRLIEEIAKLRGGKTRLKALRGEYDERHQDLIAELDEVEAAIALIDGFTEESNGEHDAYQKATEQVTAKLTEEEPVDSIGE